MSTFSIKVYKSSDFRNMALIDPLKVTGIAPTTTESNLHDFFT